MVRNNLVLQANVRTTGFQRKIIGTFETPEFWLGKLSKLGFFIKNTRVVDQYFYVISFCFTLFLQLILSFKCSSTENLDKLIFFQG